MLSTAMLCWLAAPRVAAACCCCCCAACVCAGGEADSSAHSEEDSFGRAILSLKCLNS